MSDMRRSCNLTGIRSPSYCGIAVGCWPSPNVGRSLLLDDLAVGCGKVDRRADVTRTQIELVGQGGHRMLGLPVCGGGGIAAVGTAASAASRRAIPLHDTGMLHGVQPPRLGSNLSAGYPLSVAEPVAQGPLAGPPGPAWPARTALCRNHFHLKSGRSPVRSRPWPPDTRRSAAVWWGWPAQAIASIRQNPPQVDRPLGDRKVGAGTAPHPTCRPSGRTRIG